MIRDHSTYNQFSHLKFKVENICKSQTVGNKMHTEISTRDPLIIARFLMFYESTI